jgi:hypothetical protein
MSRFPLPAADGELTALMELLCEGTIQPAQRDRLEELLRTDRDAKLYYVAYMDLHAQMQWLTRGQETGTSGQWPVVSGQRVASDEWRVESEIQHPKTQDPRPKTSIPNLQIPTLHSPLSTLHYWAISYSVATVLLAVFLLGAWSYTITHPNADSLAVKNNRGTTLSAANEKDPSQFIFVGRVSGMVDCQWADEATATFPGAAVALNRRYALKSGLMEITYDSGAKVILQGPCEYTIASARGGFLKVGKLVARVESRESRIESAKPQAANQKSEIRNQKSHSRLSTLDSRLFTVRTPTALVEDLGTEFGVEVDRSGATRSHVFEGSIAVRTSANSRQPTASLRLTAGESARVAADENNVFQVIREQGKLGSGGFARRMPKRTAIRVYNSGAGVDEGEDDPHWQIVARSDDPAFQPRAAKVMPIPSVMDFIPNSPASKWISLVADGSYLPERVTYTFRTCFDLTGMLPETAVLRGGFIVDNHVVGIRLNGRELTVPAHGYDPPFYQWNKFSVNAGFVAGRNVLEIDVYNGYDPAKKSPAEETGGHMACLVVLEGSAFLDPTVQAEAGGGETQAQQMRQFTPPMKKEDAAKH